MTETEVRVLERMAVLESKIDNLLRQESDQETRLRKLEAGSSFLHAVSAAAGAVLYYLFQLATGGKGGN